MRHIFLYAIILRFRDANLALVKEAQQPLPMNGAQDEFMSIRINLRRRRMPDDVNGTAHLFILHKIAGFAQLLFAQLLYGCA